jgi:alpha-1,3-rhamnosyl/mannosyltransferase
LLLVGHSGWRNEKIFEKIHLLSQTLPINYAGYVSESHLAQLVSGALATLYVSKYEGFGLPILESMQGGTAVLCSNHGAMAEVSNGSAWELDCSSSLELTAAMVAIQGEPELLERHVNSGLKRAAEFSWHKTAAATYEVLCCNTSTAVANI